VPRGGTGGNSVDVEGTWTIHGVTRPAWLSLTVSPDASLPGALRVRRRHAVPAEGLRRRREEHGAALRELDEAVR
jgi:hypothetical protein